MQHTHEFNRRRLLMTIAVWYALFLPGALYFGIVTWHALLAGSVVAGVSLALFWKFASNRFRRS
ncbi:MAG: hypothetical protein ACR2KM_05335 [Gemmatimonadaceae bacterium]